MSIERGYWFCLMHRNVDRYRSACLDGRYRLADDLPYECEMVPCEVHYS